MERGLSILWIDAICGSVQNSMTPPEKACPVGLQPTDLIRGAGRGTWCVESASPRATNDAEQGDLLNTIIDRAKLRRNGLRMILSLVPLTPAQRPRTDCKGASSPESFRCASDMRQPPPLGQAHQIRILDKCLRDVVLAISAPRR
jgi:hypothetical protein